MLEKAWNSLIYRWRSCIH